jgi:3-oxoacyl-[acyl-carrier protein] reductase
VTKPVTVITGTSRGLGRAFAEHFAARGHQVIGCSRGDVELGATGYRHEVVDITDEQAVKGLFSSVRKEFGRLDHLINNAGVASMNHALLIPSKTLDTLLATNVRGTFLATQEASKIMRRAHFGRILNLSTIAVPLHLEGESAYVASKAAVEGLTRVLAGELAPMGITVNAVGPGPIPTELTQGVPAETLDALVRRQAIPRTGTVEDVLHVADFFLAPQSDFVTGQVIYLGGVS